LRFNSQSDRKVATSVKGVPITNPEEVSIQLMALRMDFVAKPGTPGDFAGVVAELLSRAGLDREGLRTSMLLISDQESRLVTLITLWESGQFNKSRDRLTAWMFKLVARFADGPLRTRTSVAHFLQSESSPKLRLSDLRPSEIAELMEIASAS